MRLLLPFLLLCASCSGNGDHPSEDAGPEHCSGFVGDPALPVEVQIMVTQPDGYDADGDIAKVSPVLCEEGMRVPMIQAPQGGKHLFAGVRVKNIDTCPVRLVGTVRDVSGFIAFEGRPVNMTVAADGWAYASRPDQIADYANIGVCPNRWSSRDIFEQPYQLEMKVSDKDNRSGMASMQIVPYCGEPKRETLCMCECALGVCPDARDAGPSPR